MSRPQYRAFLKRFDRSKWATLKKSRNGLLPETARPGRRALYTIPQLRQALKYAKNMVWPKLVRKRRSAVKRWHPVSKNPKHLAARAREALSEAAWSLNIRPAHPKVLVRKYNMPREYVRTKVRDSSDKKVRDLWKKLLEAVENTERVYRYLKATGKL